MINANKACEIATNYWKAVEKERQDIALQFCEEISPTIEARANRGVKSLTIDRKPHPANTHIVEELIRNGYKASYSCNTCKITIEW